MAAKITIAQVDHIVDVSDVPTLLPMVLTAAVVKTEVVCNCRALPLSSGLLSAAPLGTQNGPKILDLLPRLTEK